MHLVKTLGVFHHKKLKELSLARQNRHMKVGVQSSKSLHCLKMMEDSQWSDHSEPPVPDRFVEAAKVEDGSYASLGFGYWKYLPHRSQSQKKTDLLEEQYLMRGVPKERRGGKMGSRCEEETDSITDKTVLWIQLLVVTEPKGL